MGRMMRACQPQQRQQCRADYAQPAEQPIVDAAHGEDREPRGDADHEQQQQRQFALEAHLLESLQAAGTGPGATILSFAQPG